MHKEVLFCLSFACLAGYFWGNFDGMFWKHFSKKAKLTSLLFMALIFTLLSWGIFLKLSAIARRYLDEDPASAFSGDVGWFAVLFAAALLWSAYWGHFVRRNSVYGKVMPQKSLLLVVRERWPQFLGLFVMAALTLLDPPLGSKLEQEGFTLAVRTIPLAVALTEAHLLVSVKRRFVEQILGFAAQAAVLFGLFGFLHWFTGR